MPAPDSLQEFKIDSGNQNAEYRDVATITMVTKQGGNPFHGLAYEYLENKALNANQFLLNATNQPKPDYKLNQFGADFGGAIDQEQGVLLRRVSWSPAALGEDRKSDYAFPGHAERRFLRSVHHFCGRNLHEWDAAIQSIYRESIP